MRNKVLKKGAVTSFEKHKSSKIGYLDRCIKFGSDEGENLIEVTMKFKPQFNEYSFGRPIKEIEISGVYDQHPEVQAVGLDGASASQILMYEKMLSFETRGFVKIRGRTREVLWVAPFTEVQQKYLQLDHEVYLLLALF